ncbi:DEAD/DEAH box helicase [Sphingobacterium suaedae]|uniref:DEAD/DEAH box helicase n=1 Tax=Sphingobacterium suaedae TaxID=1686402 RepID=A0ABW5KFW1_9SPHI
MKFDSLGLVDPILKAIAELGFSTATPIQEQAIPVVLSGRDLIGCAQTGTGKTAAFAIPLLQFLSSKGRQPHKNPSALILAPTRELAIQIGKSFELFGKFIPLKSTVIFGGVSQHNQVQQLKNGVDILIATPGRLIDLINQHVVQLSHVKALVLDEADTMLDMGFVHDIKRVLKYIPQARQTLFFSATMPASIRKFADTLLTDPVEINVSPVSSTAQTVNQSVYFIEKKEKMQLLCSLLKEFDIEQSLVFTRTKHGADRLAKQLFKKGITTAAIHGNKSQNARQKALADFKNGSVKLLIATDIAARGIDIRDLPHVINFDLPDDSETYVHRIGRTGRAGRSGMAISFCSEEEKSGLKSIQKLIGFQLEIGKQVKQN